MHSDITFLHVKVCAFGSGGTNLTLALHQLGRRSEQWRLSPVFGQRGLVAARGGGICYAAKKGVDTPSRAFFFYLVQRVCDGTRWHYPQGALSCGTGVDTTPRKPAAPVVHKL